MGDLNPHYDEACPPSNEVTQTTDTTLSANDRLEATFGALKQITNELIAARERIYKQQQEIEQLRTLAASAESTQAAAMFQVKRAIVIIKNTRAHAAQAEAALDVERAKRLRLSDELVSINEQVGVLLGTLPSSKSISYVQ